MVVLEMNCKVCGNTSAKSTSVSFFRFPKESSKCRDWADRCDLLALFETHGPVRFHKSFRICSRHFHPKDVVFDGRKNRLLDSAIPHLSPLATEGNLNSFSLRLPHNLCRLCAEQDDNMTDIFGWRGRKLDLETKLKYFPQVINKHDILPLKICNECVSKVNQFYDFILNCARAETKLRAMLGTKVSNQLPRSVTQDDKPDWDSGMETSSNETPKLVHCHNLLTSFSDNMAANCYDQVLLDSLITPDTPAQAMGAEFAKNAAFDHDYSNVMSGDQLLPLDEQTSTEETKFACRVCWETFRDWEALSAHSAAHGHSPTMECTNELCDGVFCSRFPFERAARPEEAACDKNLGESCRCGKKVSRKRLRSSHDDTHSEDSHQCAECGKLFRSRASLRQHGSVHSEKRLHDCRECGMSFKRKDTLRNHLRIHTGERPFVCKVCGFAFKQRGDCVKHENNHGKCGDDGERKAAGG